MHCVVETIHNIVETHVSNARENWRRPQVETDSYVIIPVAMPFQVKKRREKKKKYKGNFLPIRRYRINNKK